MRKHPEWLSHFSQLASLDNDVWRQVAREALCITLPAGEMVFREGENCSKFLLVIEGSVRVQKLSEGGREIVLYRVEEGQSCVLTTACMLGGQPYNAEAITETQVKAVALPNLTFQRALHGSQGFREFVFGAYAERVTSLLMLIDAIAFGRIEQRLATHLLSNIDLHGELLLTHQELARDLAPPGR
ncbi:Crp/Fnr family transcriptional regulator [Nitrincola sp. A-D6]|uniref:Crp/Fnr family transcriptional regulator n=1 Tax=Nitrincola sp. A-D6 TaxID=1545442 RepID=UPI000A8C2E36|nr:Crp/Fnr family transcriptional regulator [Nitrincola sp. A-D6]